jgi:hypothetical protein
MGHLFSVIRVAAALAISWVGIGMAAAGTMPRYGVFVYSNLCIEGDSGDTAGTRITLYRYPEGDRVMYEYAEGALARPVIADLVKVDERSGLLRFAVTRPGAQAETISTRLTNDGEVLSMRGPWCGADVLIRLPRVEDFSRRMQQCRPCPARS